MSVNCFMMKAIFQAILLTGTVLAQTAQTNHPNAPKRAVSVTVMPWSPPAENALVHISRVELVEDSLRLEIENGAPDAVVAVAISYPFSGCFIGHAAIGSGDAKRIPGMDSIDIPAHGRTSYTDDHMASHLAVAAIMQKTRYVQADAVIGAVVFASGKKIEIGAKPKNSSYTDPAGLAEKDICEKWPWEEVLDEVHAFQPPPDRMDIPLSGNHGKAGVSYTCGVLDNVLHCPN